MPAIVYWQPKRAVHKTKGSALFTLSLLETQNIFPIQQILTFKIERHILMDMDPNSLERIKTFIEFIQQAKQDNVKLSFVSTPTEHGDNINVVATINGQRVSHGIVFWDVNLLQNRGLADTLDEEDKALGLNITDGIIEDAEKILAFVSTEIGKSAAQ